MSTVLYVAGARPNFMKVAAILKAAAGAPFGSELVHSGQHYDFEMSGVFFDELGIPPPVVHLQIGSASHGVQTGRVMAAFEEYVAARGEPPRGIVVVGDVNSTMACALVGVKLGIPVAHVEAGLRSFDRTMPEEINRVVTDAVSDLLLVSEPAGLTNLEREGVAPARVAYVGNVMIDTLVDQLAAARALDVAAGMQLAPRGYAVVTLHRPSNVDVPVRLTALARLLANLATKLAVVFPVHPRTLAKLRELQLEPMLTGAGIRLLAPLGYREFVGLIDDARLVVTDSGGIQEETTFLGIPCITLRSNTERPITMTMGTNRLVGDDLAVAMAEIDAIIAGPTERRTCAIDGWDGHAAERVVTELGRRWV